MSHSNRAAMTNLVKNGILLRKYDVKVEFSFFHDGTHNHLSKVVFGILGTTPMDVLERVLYELRFSMELPVKVVTWDKDCKRYACQINPETGSRLVAAFNRTPVNP